LEGWRHEHLARGSVAGSAKDQGKVITHCCVVGVSDDGDNDDDDDDDDDDADAESSIFSLPL